MTPLLAASNYVSLNPLYLSAAPRDPAVLKAHKVLVVSVVLVVSAVLLVHAVNAVHAVRADQKALVVNVEPQDRVVYADQEALVVNAELQESVVLWVTQATLDLLVLKVLPEYLALPEPLASKA
jgi:hypothetical protein